MNTIILLLVRFGLFALIYVSAVMLWANKEQGYNALGPVYIHRVQRTMPTRLIIAAKQVSVFS